MASYERGNLQSVSSTEINYSGASTTYTYTVPTGKRAKVSVALNVFSPISGRSCVLEIAGVEIFDSESIARAVDNSSLSAGQTVVVTIGLDVQVKGFINALEYEA